MNEKAFETAQQAAARLGVTPRAVQKWAAAVRLPGAVRHGRSWLIPKEAAVLPASEADGSERPAEATPNGIPDVYQLTPFRMAMPLVNSAYPVGEARKYIETMPDPDDRNIALCEYYFFSGRPEQAAKRWSRISTATTPRCGIPRAWSAPLPTCPAGISIWRASPWAICSSRCGRGFIPTRPRRFRPSASSPQRRRRCCCTCRPRRCRRVEAGAAGRYP